MPLTVDTGAGEHGGRTVEVHLAGAPLDVQADRRGDLDVCRQADAELLDITGRTPLRTIGWPRTYRVGVRVAIP